MVIAALRATERDNCNFKNNSDIYTLRELKEIYMDGTLIYHSNCERRFLPPEATGVQLLFALTGCSTKAEKYKGGNVVEYPKFIDKSAGILFVNLKQTKFARGFVNNIPYMYNAVDYAEQL
jgi:hypothetical protein